MAKKSKRNRRQTQRSSGTATYLFDGLVAMARPLVDSQKELGVEKMNEFADATQDYATSLEGSFNLGGYATAAAETLTDVADYVNENELDQILKDFSNFARRHPVPMIIAGALAGLAVTQLLRSSEFGFKNSSSAKNRSQGVKSGRSRGMARTTRRVNGHSNLNA